MKALEQNRGLGFRIIDTLVRSDAFILVLTLGLFGILCVFYPGTGSVRNVTNLLSNAWPLLTLVIGQMFVLIVGGIDLSQTAVMAFTSVVGGMIMTTRLDPALFAANSLWGTVLTEQGGPLSGSAWAPPAAIAAMLAVGAVIGLANGLAVTQGKMPPFMVTLIAMFFFGGLAIYATRSENIGDLPAGFVAIGTGGACRVALERGTAVLLPYSLFVAAPLALVAQVFLTRTIWGRWFYAVGINRQASQVSGVPTDKVTIAAYMLSGICAAVGSVLYTARLGNARPTLGEGMLLDIIAAAVIGGISLFGGRGKVSGAMFGVLFFVLLSNALNQMNLSYYTVNIVKGAAIAVAAMLDGWRQKKF